MAPQIRAPSDMRELHHEDLTSNSVLAATYRLPPHKRHESKLMEGTQLPVSKP